MSSDWGTGSIGEPAATIPAMGTSGDRAKLINRHFYHSRNPPHPRFITRHRHTRSLQRISQLLLRQSQLFSHSFEIGIGFMM